MAKKQIKPKSKLGSTVGAEKVGRVARDSVGVRPDDRRIPVVEKPKGGSAKYVVKGRVIYPDGVAAASVKVIAFDVAAGGEDRIGESATDEKGRYRIDYESSKFRRLPERTGRADIFIRVFSSAGEQLLQTNVVCDAPPEMVLDITLPGESSQFVVHGVVTDASQKPLAKMLVRAFDRDLRLPQPLGHSETNSSGEYRIEYRAQDFRRADAPSSRAPWLIVEVLATSAGSVLAKQEVQKADRDQTISFTLSSVGTVSEWQVIGDAVRPLLKGQGPSLLELQARENQSQPDLSPWDLTAADVDFISRDAELDPAAVEAWAASSRMQRDALLALTKGHAAQLQAMDKFGLPFFYALARQRLALDLSAVLREPATKWRQAWLAARSVNRVPAQDDGQIDLVVAALELLLRLQQFDPVRSGNGAFAQVVANSSTPMPAAVALDALAVYQETGFDDTDALLKLVDIHPSAEASIKTFVRGVRVHQLVAGHDGFSRVLNARLNGTSDSIEPLALLPSADWLQMAAEASVSSGHALRVQAHVEKQHPLPALQARLDSGQINLPAASVNDVVAFIKKDPGLANSLLRGKTPTKSRVGAEVPEVQQVLGNLGLFARSGLSMQMAGELMGNGIKSPGAAIRHGREYIRNQLLEALPKEAAEEVVVKFFGTLEPILSGANGFLIDVAGSRAYQRSFGESPSAALTDAQRENLPTLPGVFGDLDECICRPCESMLGQPAYLVDLLNLLSTVPGAFDLLDSRRQDIPRLQLSCAKAEEPIQHIDIVLEILGRAVDREADAEHYKQAVDEALARAIFSWGLPFDRGYATAKSYLAKLGVTRFDLLSLSAGTTDRALAAETLNLSSDQTDIPDSVSEWKLLTQQLASYEVWVAYGFTQSENIEIVDPASGELLTSQFVQDLLVRASFLIDRTGLALHELEEAIATEFVAGDEGGLHLTNRAQCKTSAMRLPAEGSILGDILDRLHRFVRLRNKLPGWSIRQLNKAIAACNGLEDGPTSSEDRESTLVKLAIMKRLHDRNGLSLELLTEAPIAADAVRRELGFSVQEFSLLTALTALDPLSQDVDLESLDRLCKASEQIKESGLTLEQAAGILIPESQLISMGHAPKRAAKIAEKIEAQLIEIQQRLRSVVAVRKDSTLDSQVTEALTAILGPATATDIVDAIRDAGAEDSAHRTEHLALLSTLHQQDTFMGVHSLGSWVPLMSVSEAEVILKIASALSISERFKLLLEAIARRRRERELLAAVTDLCGQPEPEAALLLTSRLLLDRGGRTDWASDQFLSVTFWDGENPPQISGSFPELHAWMGRLERFIALGTALKLDRELLSMCDTLFVDRAHIPERFSWRGMLSMSSPVTSAAWFNMHWQALLSLLWLQRADQVSRPVLREVLDRLAQLSTAEITEEAVRPLATRVGVSAAQTVAIVASVANANTLRDVMRLRRAFELLVLARHLGANAEQLAQLANLADNAQASETAQALLRARIGEVDWPEVLRKMEDPLRQQQRDALVAYLVHLENSKFNSANDLYEHYFIDPQVEPCFDTTYLLEAITATQLLTQRILFGLEEGITASEQLKQRWTWMRNYRVWEANRKVFLFPENWLFPELRDDKSSSFKQLESALGQGELTQDLAQQAFGHFLDDVAQMGQVQVLAMYEDVARLDTGEVRLEMNGFPSFRTLYVVARTPNPPYVYFWRRCKDFGSPYMEWRPWERIELNIAGDHLLPFVINRQLVVAWPVIKRSEPDVNEQSSFEITFGWSRHNGVQWCQPKMSRDVLVLARAERFDDRQGIHLEGFVTQSARQNGSAPYDLAVLNVFTKSKLQTSAPVTSGASNGGAVPLTAFFESDEYTVISQKTGKDEYKSGELRITDELDESAQLEVNWSCWILVKENSADVHPVVLELSLSSSPSIRRIRIVPKGGRPFATLSLGHAGRFLCTASLIGGTGEETDFLIGGPREEIDEIIVGELPTTLWEVESLFNGRKTDVRLSKPGLETPRVAPGTSVASTLVFELDASMYTIADLGLEDLVPGQFERRGSYEFSASDELRDSSHQIELRPPGATRCWMNGFIEPAGSSSFSVSLPSGSGSFQVLGSSAANLLYQVIPAISGRPSTAGQVAELVPRVWYYREGRAQTYIDVASEAFKNSDKFCLFPSGFSEAFDYCLTWQDSLTLLKGKAQGGLFDAQHLPLKIAGMALNTIRLAGATNKLDTEEQRKLGFDTKLPNACYNWEVFFHAPLLIADQLSKQHKFEEAEHWLRFVFDPTDGGTGTDATRFLKFRGFHDLVANNRVIDELTALAQVAGGAPAQEAADAVQKLIDRWSATPFRPYLIARRRQIAFLWRTLFAYLDNLIAWADSLYRRDTIESINEATMLYVLAERILGRRPRLHEGKSNRQAINYLDKLEKWDGFANYWVHAATQNASTLRSGSEPGAAASQPAPDGMLYFCMPFNDKIASYWNVVEARLSNVRNCRSIEGVKRTLPLMDAPIDPELLVRATAAGLDLGDAISGLYAPPPHYRYGILAARAAELTNEAKSLSAAMLSAIEKRDAEQLAHLRSSNEISLLRLVREVRTLQITEAERNIDALRATRTSTSTRYRQYQRLLGKKDIKVPAEQENAGEESMLGNVDTTLTSERSNFGLIKEEDEQYVGFKEASGWSIASGIAKTASGVAHLLAAPALSIILSESVGKGLTAGAHGLSAIGDAFSTVSQGWRSYAEQQGMMAGHIRRRDEWAFQSNQTLKDLQQIDKQILANQIRIDITKKELNNHIEQTEQAKALDEVMRSKFSNEQLYEWMVSQLSGLYFNAYRMALEMARRAERAAARELGVASLNILRSDYWESPRAGLLAGERLHQDIKRLEVAYLDQNRREYELTKHISLRRLDPEALVTLRVRSEGRCECTFDIPEWLFDLDAPGQYLRRIKSVSVSIPSVVGPYASVNCKLTLLKSQIRHDLKSANAAGYPRSTASTETRFTDLFGASEAVVTSTANADSGMFETQLRDERFLPFEGSGAISTWRLELPGEFPQFDYATISDVVLTIRYTAREGGESLREHATGSIKKSLLVSAEQPLRFDVLLSCRSDFPSEWAQARADARAELKIPISRHLLPYWMSAAEMKVRKLSAFSDSETPGFKQVWPKLETSSFPEQTFDNFGFGQANFGPVANHEDQLVLLSVG